MSALKEHIIKLSKSSIVYGAGGIANKLITLLLLPLFTRYLTPTDFGIISILTMLNMLLLPIFSLGFGTSIGVCYFETQSSVERGKVIWNSFYCLIASSITMFVLLYSIENRINQTLLDGKSSSSLILLTIASTVFGILVQPFQLKLQFEQKPRPFVLISMVSLIVSSAVSISGVILFHRSVQGVLEGMLIGQIVAFVLFFSISFKQRIGEYSAETIKKLFRAGIPMIPAFFFIFVMQNGVRYFLEIFHGLSAVGVYTIGSNFGLIMGLVTGSFISSWTPYALSYSNNQAAAQELLSRITYYFIAGFGLLVTIIFLYSRAIIIIFTDNVYLDAHTVVGLSAAAQFYSALFLMLLPPAYFANEATCVVKTQSIAMGIFLLISIMIIPIYGIVGAALAVCLGFMSLVMLQFLWNNYYKKGYYLSVPYNINKIMSIHAVFIAFALLSFANTENRLFLNIIYSTLLMVILVIIVVRYYVSQEVNQVIRIAKEKFKAL